MIKKTFLLRLVLDFVAAGLLLAALAYYWLDNTAHELIGTGIFLLIVVHNFFNRRWYGAISKAREARSLIDVMLTISLLVAMLALLVSSLMISRTVFGFLQLKGGFTVRQIHILAAYWSLIFVAIHLGVRWKRIMHAARSALNISGESTARTLALRFIAGVIAAYGLLSSFVMDVGSKLWLQMSLDGWDFEESTPGFFLNWISIAGLYIFLAHYVLSGIQKRKRRADSPPEVANTPVCKTAAHFEGDLPSHRLQIPTDLIPVKQNTAGRDR